MLCLLPCRACSVPRAFQFLILPPQSEQTGQEVGRGWMQAGELTWSEQSSAESCVSPAQQQKHSTKRKFFSFLAGALGSWVAASTTVAWEDKCHNLLLGPPSPRVCCQQGPVGFYFQYFVWERSYCPCQVPVLATVSSGVALLLHRSESFAP